jgi:hypothetical protein
MLTACANKPGAGRKVQAHSDRELSVHSVSELRAGVYAPLGQWLSVYCKGSFHWSFDSLIYNFFGLEGPSNALTARYTFFLVYSQNKARRKEQGISFATIVCLDVTTGKPIKGFMYEI